MADGLFGQAGECGIVVHIQPVGGFHHGSAVAVAGVFAEAEVGDDDQLRGTFFNQPDGLLDNPVVVAADLAGVVFFVGDTEDQNGWNFQADHLIHNFVESVEGPLELAWHGFDLALEIGPMVDEQRIDQIFNPEVILADHVSQAWQASEPSHAHLGKNGLIHGNGLVSENIQSVVESLLELCTNGPC